MALDILNERGLPLAEQRFGWKDFAQAPYSKLDDDAFTRVRTVVMSSLETHAVGFSHAAGSTCQDLRPLLAELRRVEAFQAMAVGSLHPGDQSGLETAIGFQQAAVEVGAMVARAEPQDALADLYRGAVGEDLDLLYRLACLLDRVAGQDANTLLQCRTAIRPGRRARDAHRHPLDDLRLPLERRKAEPRSLIHACLMFALADRARAFYQDLLPTCSDPLARMLCAECAALKEQQATRYGSLEDPGASWLEKWLLREATEAFGYWSCLLSEGNPRIKGLWERFLQFELGHLHLVLEQMGCELGAAPVAYADAFRTPLPFTAQRDYLDRALEGAEALVVDGADFMPPAEEAPSGRSTFYRQDLSGAFSPSEEVARGYCWRPGGELFAEAIAQGEALLKGGQA